MKIVANKWLSVHTFSARVKSVLLLVLILSGSIVQLASAQTSTTSVSEPDPNHPTTEEAIKTYATQYAYYRLVSECRSNSQVALLLDRSSLSSNAIFDHSATGSAWAHWLKIDTRAEGIGLINYLRDSIASGYFDEGNVQIKCVEDRASDFINAAFQAWGTTASEMYCSDQFLNVIVKMPAGFENSDCANSDATFDKITDDDSDWSDALGEYLKALLGIDVFKPDSTAMHHLYASGYIRGCTTGIVENPDESYTYFHVLQPDGTLISVTAATQSPPLSSSDKNTYINSCNDLKNDDLKDLLHDIGEEECVDIGYIRPEFNIFDAEATFDTLQSFATQQFYACADGFVNIVNGPQYCITTYANLGPYLPDATLTEMYGDTWKSCSDGQALGTGVVIPTPVAPGSTDGDGGTTCALENVGWIVCPILNFMGEVNGAAYSAVDGMLETDTQTVSVDSGTYDAWQVMRNFANVGFVIFFLIIIFSQITNIGISNYGLKKLFPRLIIAAILVNLSFYICQIAVDLSNITGGSLKSLMESLAGYQTGLPGSASGSKVGEVLSGAALLGGVVIGGAALIAGGIGILMPVLLAAFLAVIVTLGILAIRQVMIILLAVIAPLAFLAMLLPNTESLYKKWRKMFVGLLVVYPMIALLFGASALASSIIVNVGAETKDAMKIIMSILITFVPLALTPTLLKGSLNSIPMLGKMAEKLASKANSNIGSKYKDISDLRKSRKDAGLNWRGGERKPAKIFKGLRNTEKTEQERYKKGERRPNGTIAKEGELKKDKAGNLLPPKVTALRRRSMTQVMGDAKRTVNKETEVNKGMAEGSWAARGLDGRTNAARKTGAVLDAEKVGGLRKQTTEKMYEGRLEKSKLANGEVREIYDRLHDAGSTIKTLEKEQEQRQLTRTKDNAVNTAAGAIGLSELSGVTAGEGVSEDQAARLQKLGNLSDIDATGGGGLKVLHENQEAAEQNIKEIEAGFKEELAKRKGAGGDLHLSAVAELASGKVAKGYEDNLTATISELASSKQSAEDLRKKLLVVPERKDTETDQEFGARLKEYNDKVSQLASFEGEGGVRERLQAAAAESKIGTERSKYAEGEVSLGLDERITTDEAYAKRVAGISKDTGRTVAKATARLEEDRQGDVKVTESEYEEAHLSAEETSALHGVNADGGEMFDENGVFIDTPANQRAWTHYEEAKKRLGKPYASKTEPQPKLDLVQEEALVRRTVKAGDEKDNMYLANHLKEVGAQATRDKAVADANPDDLAAQDRAEASRKRAVTLEKAAAQQYGSNPKGISPFLSTDRREKMSHGDLDVSLQESITETFGAEKVEARWVSGWNINHFAQAAIALTRDPAIIQAEMERFAEEKRAQAEAKGEDGDKAYNESMKKQRTSMAESIKALDEAEDGPYNVDERSAIQIQKMRDGLAKLEEAGVIPKPKPTIDGEYYRPLREEGTGRIRRGPDDKPLPWGGTSPEPSPTAAPPTSAPIPPEPTGPPPDQPYAGGMPGIG